MSVRYLLDTNICIYIAKHNPPAVREHFARHAANELAMSVITLGELRFGAEKSQSHEQAMATIQQLESLIGDELEELQYPLCGPNPQKPHLRLRTLRAIYPPFYSLKEWSRLKTPLGRFVNMSRLVLQS